MLIKHRISSYVHYVCCTCTKKVLKSRLLSSEGAFCLLRGIISYADSFIVVISDIATLIHLKYIVYSQYYHAHVSI